MVIKYIKQILHGRSPTHASPTDPEQAPNPPPGRVHRPIPVERIDQDAIKILRRLTRHGYEAYLVGGGVRDLLMGFAPKDFDVATSAKPHEVKRLFRNCRVIGRRFRLAHIYFQGKIIEVATFRAPAPEPEPGEDGDLLIRSDNVFGTPEEDAIRRDFTLNALFYDVEHENILDFVGGMADLEARRVRTIGDPDIRLREDPIRMLRAIRLAARLGCRIEKRTRDAIVRHRRDIQRGATPRILEDLLRMFRGGASEQAFQTMQELGVLEQIFPELADYLLTSEEEEVEAFFSSLRVLDELTRAGREFTTPVHLGVLFAPLIHGDLARQEGRVGDPTKRAADFVRPLAVRLGISRRDSDRMRLIVHSLRRFVPGRRPRRFSERAFSRRPFFPEALDLFEVFSRASGDLGDEVERWRRLAGTARRTPAPRGKSKRREMGEKGAQTAPIHTGDRKDEAPSKSKSKSKSKRSKSRRSRRRRGSRSGSSRSPRPRGAHVRDV
jgi:poly(A) polymerase